MNVRVDLTAEQLRLVNHKGGPAAVDAVPGAGKTTAILALLNSLRERGVDPRRILAVTFTKAAADQLRPKLAAKFGCPEFAKAVDFRTLHAFCYLILRHAGAPYSEVIADPGQYIRPIMQAVGMQNTDVNAVEGMATDISRYIMNERPKGYHPNSCTPDLFFKVLNEYTRIKKEELRKPDFSDLIEEAAHLLEAEPAMRDYWRGRYDWRIIDEHQDTSPLPWKVVRLTTPEPDTQPNLVVVGDADQAIFTWAGATNRFLVHFDKEYPGAVTLPFSLTHRCPKAIMEPAARMIVHNTQRLAKNIHSDKPGGRVTIHRPADPAEEIKQVIAKLKAAKDAGRDMRDFAVLYRTHAQALPLVPRLEEEGIPFYQIGGVKDPFSRWMAKDVLAFLRVAHGKGNAGDDLDRILRRPRREGFTSPFFKDLLAGAKRASKNAAEALAYLERNGGFFIKREVQDLNENLATLTSLTAVQAIAFILGPMGYQRGMRDYCEWSGSDFEEALDHLQALSLLPKEGAPASAFLEIAATPPKPRKERDNISRVGVCLTTGHSAKGLEWRNPIIIGATEQMHPRVTSNGGEDIESARRLFYVMMTRAIEELDIYVPLKWGPGKDILPSPFLGEAGLVSSDGSGAGMAPRQSQPRYEARGGGGRKWDDYDDEDDGPSWVNGRRAWQPSGARYGRR